MSRWFRHYAGMMRDDKLVRAAIKSGQSVERVVWIWGAILESAAELNDDGRFDLDSAEAAYFLRADQADIDAVLSALAAGGRISGDCVVKWGDRQFSSDTSAERTRRYRDKQKQRSDGDSRHQSNDVRSHGDGAVTSPSRDGDAPETETETETETESRPSDEKRASARASAKTPRDELCEVLDGERAQAVIDHRKRLRKPLTAHAAKLLAAKLRDCQDPNFAADAMIANGWLGFEQEWLDNRTGHGHGPNRNSPGNDGILGALARVVEKRADTAGQRVDSTIVALADARPDGGNPQPIECPEIPAELWRGQRQGAGG